MRLPRRLFKLTAALVLGMPALRLPAAELANPYDVLPRCPDDAAAREVQKLSSRLRPDAGYSYEAGDILRLDVDGNTELAGGVVIRQGETELSAERFSGSLDPPRMEVEGTVEFRDPELVVRGNTGSFKPGEAVFEGVQFELPSRAARGAATNFSVNEDGILKLSGVRYTTCPEGSEDWLLRADSISINSETSTGVARDARVEFFGVPLLRLPVISFPVGDARKSGFLLPGLGTTTRGGVLVSVPWYWNIAPQQDFTFTPTWHTARGVDFEGNYRYLTRNNHGELLGNLLPGDNKTGKDRSRWRITNVTDLPGQWRMTLAGENVSDVRYFEDFSQGAATDGSSTAFLPRLAELSWRDANLHTGVLVRNFQTLDQDLPQVDRPATEAPRFYLQGDWRSQGAVPVTYGIAAEATRFRHPGEIEGWRVDAQPQIGLDFSGPGYFFRPAAMFDAAGYSLTDTAPGQDDKPTRALPLLSLDTGLVFERESRRGQRYLTLEPRLMYLYAPYRDQDDLPLFDTDEPDLNWIQLFRPNRYSGLDRISDANQVSLGFTTQMYRSDSGTRILSTTIGQTFNFSSPRVRLPDEPPDAGNASDLIAEVELSGLHNWSVSTGIQWNPYADQTERAEVRLRYQPAPRTVFNLGYRFQNERREQGEASAAWALSSHWRAYGRVVYSLRDSRLIEQFAGFEYDSCCWNLRALARENVSRRTGERDRSIYMQLELKGLSSVGQAVDAFLAKAIRGYSPGRQR